MLTSSWILVITIPLIVMNLTVIAAQPIAHGEVAESNPPVVHQIQAPPTIAPSSWQQQYSQKFQAPPPPSDYHQYSEYAQKIQQPATYYPPEQAKSPQELAAEDGASKRATILETIKRDCDDVNSSLNNMIAGLQQDDDILDKIQAPSKAASELLQDLKLNLDADLSVSRKTLATLVTTLQAIAADVIEQDDDIRVHDLLLSLDNRTHTLVQDFSSAVPSSPDGSNQEGGPQADLPNLTGFDSAVADQEEP